LTNKRNLGNDIYQDVKYFIEKKAFKNNIEVQNEFGKNDYRAVRKSQKKMILFLDEMWKACDKYKTQLIAAQFSQTNIDEILVVRDVLRNNNTNQELFKKGRPVLTNDRIEVLNTCYDNMELILEAAQRVFRNNEVKRKQYVFNPNSNTDQVLSNIEEPIAANAVRNLGLLPTGARTFRFKNNGPTALQIGLSIDGLIFVGNTVTSGGVGSDDIDIADLNSTGNIVIVQNQRTTQVGNFKLEILG
jgi:peptidoglycan hydrolase-like protein with peptidoglycan-binding domain